MLVVEDMETVQKQNITIKLNKYYTTVLRNKKYPYLSQKIHQQIKPILNVFYQPLSQAAYVNTKKCKQLKKNTA